MRKTLLLSTSLLLVLLFLSAAVSAQWQENDQFGFKIKVPESWTKNSYRDGTDWVWDFFSPDDHAGIQLRTFEGAQGLTTDLLAQVYEEQMLPASTQKESLNDHTSVNGIPGKQGFYILNVDGTKVATAIFYTVQNDKGYVLSAFMTYDMMEQKEAEIREITRSFTIDGFSAPATGTPGNATDNAFRINEIILTDRVDESNRAIRAVDQFSTTTPEILAVIDFQGGTSEDLYVSWVYNEWDQVITRDAYNFEGGGGIGIVSLSKPDNDWPTGSYSILFEMGGKTIETLHFTVTQPAAGGQSVAGHYNFTGRSDGKSLVNYHYIMINEDGTYIEKYQPKNSGDYVGGNEGTWKVDGNRLSLIHGGITDTYTINGTELSRRSDNGVVFTFRK